MEKSDLYSIAYDCPKMNRDKDCPFSEIEHLSFRESIDWVDELDDETKKALLTHIAQIKRNNKIST